MLTDIYARSMLTATRQDCVKLRDLPASTGNRRKLPQAYSAPPATKGALAKLAAWIKRQAAGRQTTRCLDLQKL